jgi:hypothetical protein
MENMWHIQRRVRNAFRILVGKLEEKRKPGRFGYRWKDNIKTELKKKEIRCEVMDWMQVAEERTQWHAL